MQVGDKVTYVKVELFSDFSVKEVEVEEMECIGVNEHLACLNGELFPKIALDNTYTIHAKLNKVSVNEENSKTMIDIFGKFSIRIYSKMTIKRIENKINAEFNNWLESKVSAYCKPQEVKINLGLTNK
jgi:hypothetical protein